MNSMCWKAKLSFIFMVCFIVNIQSQRKQWVNESLEPSSIDDAIYYKEQSKNKRNLTVTYFYKNDTPYRKFTEVHGVLEGHYFEYYPTGELKIEGDYKEGKKHGIWKEYYTSGKIKEKGKYSKGSKVGIWKQFYKNEK